MIAGSSATYDGFDDNDENTRKFTVMLSFRITAGRLFQEISR